MCAPHYYVSRPDTAIQLACIAYNITKKMSVAHIELIH
jgi:hypothetical protein